MQLSERLKMVAGLVTPGLPLADIGTDHAYIPIFLAQTGIIPCAIAADVNRGPLLRAQEHIRAYNLETRIETRLSDGLNAFAPGEAQCILIAGMGGALTVRILQRARETGRLAGCRELILQPQSEIRDVRAWLENAGWGIAREEMLIEDGKYYVVMKARPRPENTAAAKSGAGVCGQSISASDNIPEKNCPCQSENAAGTKKAPAVSRKFIPDPDDMPQMKRMTEAELAFGPDLLRRRHPVLRQYLLHEEQVQLKILQALKNGNGRAAKDREQEISARLSLLKEALQSAYS